jgi:hypothetical protein
MCSSIKSKIRFSPRSYQWGRLNAMEYDEMPKSRAFYPSLANKIWWWFPRLEACRSPSCVGPTDITFREKASLAKWSQCCRPPTQTIYQKNKNMRVFAFKKHRNSAQRLKKERGCFWLQFIIASLDSSLYCTYSSRKFAILR